jgi:hypothetical protein
MLTCPRCGGSQLEQAEPGMLVCRTPIQVGGIPPGAHGQPHPVAIFEPCGTRFQVAPTATTPIPCDLPRCGLDSVGTCQGDCGRRVCFRHTGGGSTVICPDCSQAIAQKAAERKATATAERAHMLKQIGAVLKCSNDPLEVADTLTAHEELLASVRWRDDCRETWSRLVDVLALTPPYEYVQVQGRRRLFSSPSWSEKPGSRVGVWLAPAVGTFSGVWTGPREMPPETGFDLFLGRDGRLCCRDRGRRIVTLDLDRNGGDTTRVFILPARRPFETMREAGGDRKELRVADGIPMNRSVRFEHDPPGQTWLRPGDPNRQYQGYWEPRGFVRAVATILRSVVEPSGERGRSPSS